MVGIEIDSRGGSETAASVRWGFVGLGEMGYPMATRLLSEGFPLTVFDVDRERLRSLAAKGAIAARDLRDLGSRSRVVSICVRDTGQVQTVLTGGVLDALGEGGIVLLHSTVGRADCRRISELAQSKGVDLLDAPISGMRMAAEQGTLTFFVGGSAEALERVRQGLSVMGKTILHVGDVGAGQVIKVLNNLAAFVCAGVVDEALSMATAAGVAEASFLEALGSGSGRSWALENWEFLSQGWVESHPAGSAGVRQIIEKDLGLSLELGCELSKPVVFGSIAARLVPNRLSGLDKGM